MVGIILVGASIFYFYSAEQAQIRGLNFGNELQYIQDELKNEQSEFDAQILSLVKVTIDSINVKELKKHVSIDENGSIKLLAEFLNNGGVRFDAATFLGGLQGVRSTGVAHRRGSKYEKTIARLGIKDNELIKAFDSILEQVTDLLIEVEKAFLAQEVDSEELT